MLRAPPTNTDIAREPPEQAEIEGDEPNATQGEQPGTVREDEQVQEEGPMEQQHAPYDRPTAEQPDWERRLSAIAESLQSAIRKAKMPHQFPTGWFLVTIGSFCTYQDR